MRCALKYFSSNVKEGETYVKNIKDFQKINAHLSIFLEVIVIFEIDLDMAPVEFCNKKFA